MSAPALQPSAPKAKTRFEAARLWRPKSVSRTASFCARRNKRRLLKAPSSLAAHMRRREFSTLRRATAQLCDASFGRGWRRDRDPRRSRYG
jgi:hypothetical protein